MSSSNMAGTAELLQNHINLLKCHSFVHNESLDGILANTS